MKAEEAAQRVLELSQKATKGPWRSLEESKRWFEIAGGDDSLVAQIEKFEPAVNDAQFIAETRTIAPKLAEAFLVALEVIHHFSDSPIDEITQTDRTYMQMRMRVIEKTFTEGE